MKQVASVDCTSDQKSRWLDISTFFRLSKVLVSRNKMNPSQHSLVSVFIALFTCFTIADAFVVVQPSRGIVRTIPHNKLFPIVNSNVEMKTALWSTPEDESAEETIQEETSEKSLFDKVNDFLDTPILDANNRSDQGALAEALKEFVRDEPEIAQVTFSVVVVAILALLTRAVMSL